MAASRAKEEIRRGVWSSLDKLGISRFPKPVTGRIPNFEGAEKAAKRLAKLPEFRSARVVKVNPDAPQAPVRRLCLQMGKTLLMPSPRLKAGFLLLDPKLIPASALGEASTLSGAFKYGKTLGIESLPRVDLVVAGSVAVTPRGARIGKGGGYSEVEYGILKELRLLEEDTPVVTTIHDAQLVEEVPVEEHDFMVDIIITPTRVIRTRRSRPQPTGILWGKVSSDMLNKMPILRELKERARCLKRS